MNNNYKKMHFLHWAVLILVSLIFFMAGLTAFTGNEDQLAIFQKAHYSMTIFYSIAIVQLVGAVMLWIPSLRIYAAVVLMLIMVGALVTQIMLKDYLHCFSPLVFGGLLYLLIHNWK